jgi:hypothetical protein
MPEPDKHEERPLPDWPLCSCHDDGCIGVRIGNTAYCLAHLEHEDPRKFKAFFRSLRPGASLDLRGTQLSWELLKRVLDRLKRDEEQGPSIGDARFDQARFTRSAWFGGAQFNGVARFDQARFSRDALFERARFNGFAGFFGVEFKGEARFEWAQFCNFASFVRTRFSGDAWFNNAKFSGNARFSNATFSGNARFYGVEFSGDARFRGAQFSRDALFYGAQFERFVGFQGTRFDEDADFKSAQFTAATAVGPLRADLLHLDRASFGANVVIEVAARRLSMVETRFEQEATLWVRYAEVLLDRAAFGKPSSLAFAENSFLLLPTPTDEEPALQQSDSPSQGRSTLQGPTLDEAVLKEAGEPQRPRLLSLRRVDVTNLVLGDLDLAWCLFRGTLNLDQLRMEGPKHFATTPRGRRWTHRRTLAEERVWRQTRYPHADWRLPSRATLNWVEERSGQPVQQPSPDHVAPLYRALRKAEEDAKYEPGAADFYYGEMEMRRHAVGTPWIEKRLLWTYWLVAGYGLRASRALLALLVVLLGATAILAAVGFATPTRPANAPITGTITGGSTVQHLRLDPSSTPPPAREQSFLARCGTAWWMALEAAAFRTPDQTLTPAGRHVQTVVRFFGPVLLGLALLSVRGRVKR